MFAPGDLHVQDFEAARMLLLLPQTRLGRSPSFAPSVQPLLSLTQLFDAKHCKCVCVCVFTQLRGYINKSS